MTADSPATPAWPSDLTRVCEQLAQRLYRSGATHPVSAAVALAARGHRGLDITQFAGAMHLPVDTVRRAEAGEVAWEDLPDVIGDLVEAIPSVDLLALADLDASYRELAAVAEG